MTVGVESIGAQASELKAQFYEKAEMPLAMRFAQVLSHLAYLQENEILIAQLGGNVEGVIDRAASASIKSSLEQADKLEEQRKQRFDDMLLLDMIDRAMAPLDAEMADKYGKNFMEKFAKKYLDKDTFNRLDQIEDPVERMRAMREELARRQAAGEIDIEEDDLIHYLDRYREEFDKALDAHAEAAAAVSAGKKSVDELGPLQAFNMQAAKNPDTKGGTLNSEPKIADAQDAPNKLDLDFDV